MVIYTKVFLIYYTIMAYTTSLLVSVDYSIFGVGSRVSNFNQSEARKHCFLASDWPKFVTLPRKFFTLYI